MARFQAGEYPFFLLSLKAGGTGLNLTAANHVIHIMIAGGTQLLKIKLLTVPIELVKTVLFMSINLLQQEHWKNVLI